MQDVTARQRVSPKGAPRTGPATRSRAIARTPGRGRGLRLLAASLLLMTIFGAAGGASPAKHAVPDRPWPATQPGLGLESDGFDSWASAAAVLPPKLVVTPPAAGTPADIKRYSGIWSGWMCKARATDLKVAFTKVGPKRAAAAIAWAGADSPPGHMTAPLSRVGDEFRFDGPDVLYKFHLRTFDERVGVETMDVMRVAATGAACSGVLRKDAPS